MDLASQQRRDGAARRIFAGKAAFHRPLRLGREHRDITRDTTWRDHCAATEGMTPRANRYFIDEQ